MNKPMKFFSKDFKIIECSSEHRLPVMVFKVYRRHSRQYVGRLNIHEANLKSLQNIINGKSLFKLVYNFKDLNRACFAAEARFKSRYTSK
nr:MAG TPA: hypothetical protein [Caudoviricetes sp.]